MSAINSISSSATTPHATGTLPQGKPKLQVPEAEHARPVAPDTEIATEEAAVDSEHLQQMIERANRQLAGAGNQRLSFGYEERLNRLYVQIKDNATGEVVREIPPRRLIEQQAAMSEMIGIILDRNV